MVEATTDICASGRCGLGGAVSPGVHEDAHRIRKEVRMAEVVSAITLLVALLVIDRLVDRHR